MAAEKPTLTFVTGNKKKLEEVKLYLAGAGEEMLPYSIVNKKLDLPELQGSSPEEIAKEKCKLAAKQVEGGVVMIEDTCLCFNALKGLPGPYIKWFLDKLGLDGLVRLISGWTDKTAYASAIFALCEGPGKEPLIFEGITEGEIVDKKGPEDFGWDPIFKPNEGEGKTFAEMTKEAKNAISHRGRALEKLRKHLGEQATSSPKKRPNGETNGATTDEADAKRQKTA